MLLNQQFSWSIYPEGDSADGSRQQLSAAASAAAVGVSVTAVNRKPLTPSQASSLSTSSARDQGGVFRERNNKWSVVVFVPADCNKVMQQIAKKRRLTGIHVGSGNSWASATGTADPGGGGSHYFVGRFDTEAEARVVYKRVSVWWELSFYVCVYCFMLLANYLFVSLESGVTNNSLSPRLLFYLCVCLC
jgi:hypothetical protein